MKKLAYGFVLSAAVAFGAANAWADQATSYVSVSSGDATIVDLGDQFAVVFSNAQSSATLVALRPCSLLRTLVVGGGGAGGQCMGGGGGGGQVLESYDIHIISKDDQFTLSVGDGGAMGTGYLAGLQGGTSSLTLPDGTSLVAYGGGGGGGFSAKEPTANADGKIGSGGGNGYGRATAPTKGTHYNYGNPGGLAQGGGGGAGAAGENPGLHAESVLYGDETAYRTQAGYGGEGVSSDISGVAEVYGSGGGGGGGQNHWSQVHAPGGTHAGAGAVRTDKTGGGDGVKEALPADEGFGAGGGGGSFSQTGSSGQAQATKGGCGTVILRFSKTDLTPLLFEVDQIPDQYFTGSAQTPAVAVRHITGGTVVDSANYDVVYEDNVNPGTATVTVIGKGAYAGLRAYGSFVISSMVRDEYAAYDDLSVRRIRVGDRIVYIFTNTTDVFTFRALVNLTLADALVVGGGGSGGHTIGGGGGGGAVVTSTVQRVMIAGREYFINVGAGGLHATTGGFASGVQGGTSTLTFQDASTLVAYGGGGGGGYNKGPTSSATGEIASGGGSGAGGTFSAGNDGVNYSSVFGHIGGTGMYSFGGGGGGAGAAGLNGTSASGGNGGEGIVSSITGIAEVYGSGGGGGARNSGVPGAGGTNAGSGTNGVQTGFAPLMMSGRNGFGGGGGGGGFENGRDCFYGGDGGCGTIVLSFVLGANVGQPTIASKSIAFPDGITQPKVTVTLGNSRPEYGFVATVSIVLRDGDGAELGTRSFASAVAGEPLEWLAPVCVEPGTTVTAHITVTCDGADAVFGTETAVATGEMSPYYRRGGGAGVIHVRQGATGRNDGSDWFNAYTDFRASIGELSAERPELWFSGNETEPSVKETIAPPVAAVIRGGFAGTENSAAERAEGAMSICDAVNVGYCFSFANTQEVTLDGFWLKRGEGHNLVKSEAGDITVTNCVSSDASGKTSGHGGYLVGSSVTVARFANVRFSNLIGGEQLGGNKGSALYLEKFSRVYIDGCTFSTNGCSFDYSFGNSMYDQDGAALFAKNAPLTVRGTRFLANRSQALDTSNSEGGGVVRVTGSCGATAFTNCLFVGNEVVHAFGNTKEYNSDTAGMLAVSPSSGTVDIVNCTFAMGLATITCGPAAVAARSGTVNVLNSIFYGNTNCAWNTAGFDIHVAAGATANVSYCLFEDDSAGRIVCADGGTTNLETSTFVYGNPLFVTDAAPSSFLKTATFAGGSILLDQNKIGELMAFNAHVRGGLGYFDEKTGELVADFKSHGAVSPAQDAGNPAAIFYSGEPDCQHGWHGRRGNLGYYGNTPWATMTQLPGSLYYIR